MNQKTEIVATIVKEYQIVSEENIKAFINELSNITLERGVFARVEDFFRIFIEFNPSILPTLFDYVNEADFYDEESDADTFLKHIQDGQTRRPHLEDYQDAPQPSLRFSKVYIKTMMRYFEIKPQLTYKNGSLNYLTYISENASFETGISGQILGLVFKELSTKGIIYCSKETFVKAFSGYPLNEIKWKIKWLNKSGGGIDKKSLVTLIFLLAPDAPFQGEQWDRKVSRLFEGPDGEPISLDLAKKAKSNWCKAYGLPSRTAQIDWQGACVKVAGICKPYLS